MSSVVVLCLSSLVILCCALAASAAPFASPPDVPVQFETSPLTSLTLFLRPDPITPLFSLPPPLSISLPTSTSLLTILPFQVIMHTRFRLPSTSQCHTLPSPSLGPPLLSASPSPPLPCGIPLPGGGGVVVGGGAGGAGGVVVGGGAGGGGGVVVGGGVGGGGGAVVGGGVGAGGGMVVVGGGAVVWLAGVGGGCWAVAVFEFDVSTSGMTIAAAITTAIRTETIVLRLVICSP